MAAVVEKLAELGIKTMIKVDGKETEIKTTKEVHDRFTESQEKSWPIPCAGFRDGQGICPGPIWFVPTHPLKR